MNEKIINFLNSLISNVSLNLKLNINKQNWLYGIINALAKALASLEFLIENKFFDKIIIARQDLTALKETGEVIGLQYNLATSSYGKAIIQGTPSNIIPVDYIFSNGIYDYQTQTEETISTNTVAVLSASSLSGIVKIKTTLSHNFATGMILSVSGANEAQFNVSNIAINVMSEDEFTYVIENQSTVTASGSLIISANYATLSLTCVTTGSDTALSNGTIIAIGQTITGVDSFALVNYYGIENGSDDETTEAYSERIDNKFKNNSYNYTEALIEDTMINQFPEIKQVLVAKEYKYRVKVSSIRLLTSGEKISYPDYDNDLFRVVEVVGYHGIYSKYARVKITGSSETTLNIPKGLSSGAMVYEILDNDKFIVYVGNNTDEDLVCTNVYEEPLEDTTTLFIAKKGLDLLPSSQDLTRYSAFINDQIFPFSDYIYPFETLLINFTITNVFPDSQGLKDEIKANLEYFFASEVKGGVAISKLEYDNIIYRSRYNNIKVKSFTVAVTINSSVVTDINTQKYQYPVLNNVSVS